MCHVVLYLLRIPTRFITEFSSSSFSLPGNTCVQSSQGKNWMMLFLEVFVLQATNDE